MLETVRAELNKFQPTIPSEDDFEYTRTLVKLFEKQLVEGCSKHDCNTRTCATYRKSIADKPFRGLTGLSARIAAVYLVHGTPEKHICPGILDNFHHTGNSYVPLQVECKDPKSFTQHIMDAEIVRKVLQNGQQKEILSRPLLGRFRLMDNTEECMNMALQMGDASDVAWAWLAGAQFLIMVLAPWPSGIVDEMNRHENPGLYSKIMGWPEYERGRKLASMLVRLMFRDLEMNPEWFKTAEPGFHKSSDGGALRLILDWMDNKSDEPRSLVFPKPRWPKGIADEKTMWKELNPHALLVFWLQRVFLDLWDGELFLHVDSLALKTMAAMELLYHTSEPLTPSAAKAFRMTIVENRLDAYDVARRLTDPPSEHVPLTDFTWLLSTQLQAKIFRGVCLGRMTKSVEQSRLYIKSINETLFWLGQAAPPLDNLASNQLRIATSLFLALEVNRSNLVEDAYNQLWRREEREFERPLRVSIKNAGEEGLDQGGVAQEFFLLLLAEILDPKYGMFQIDDRTKMTWFDPKSLEPLYKYELLGLLIGLAIYNGFNLPVNFPSALYFKLLGVDVRSIEHIKDGWPELARGLQQLLDWDDGDVGDVIGRTYEFSFEAYGKVMHIDMTNPDQTLTSTSLDEAPLVTNANRDAFVRDYIAWLTDRSIRPQYRALAKGFQAVFPAASLSLLCPRTLHSIVEGQTVVDARALELATGYDGFAQGDRLIRDFWHIVRNEYDNARRRRLLEFVTASDRLPVNGAENLEFVVQRNGGDTEAVPGAMTCFGRLLLPEYDSRAKLRRKLDIALDNAQGFGVR